MKRPFGRPRLDSAASAPSAAVHLKLRAEDYDRIDRLARQERVSVQDVIRRGVRRLLDERGGSM